MEQVPDQHVDVRSYPQRRHFDLILVLLQLGICFSFHRLLEFLNVTKNTEEDRNA